MKKLILAGLMLLSSVAMANATVITFDEYLAGNNNVPITDLYKPAGVTFGASNAGTWGGTSNGDPGNWSLQGTNGSNFLGNNSAPYTTSIIFTSPVNNVSLDVSRSNGSSSGQTLTVQVFDGSTLLGSDLVTLGSINTWSTVSFNFGNITDIELYGSNNSDFSPYGIDNLQFSSTLAPVPEPGTIALLGLGMAGLAIYGKRRMNKEA